MKKEKENLEKETRLRKDKANDSVFKAGYQTMELNG